MIEGFESQALVIANLVSPKEKFFGLLISLSTAGLTMRGINIESFDDWARQIARKEEPALAFVTMFVPLFRVERIFLDEPAGAVRSYAQCFEDVAGRPIREVI